REVPLAGSIGQTEAPLAAHPLVVILKARDGCRDEISDLVVVGDPRRPILAQSTLGHTGHNRRLAHEVLAGRRHMTLRAVHHAHGILYGDELHAAALPVEL